MKSMTTLTKSGKFTGQKAIFLNMKEDGKKFRSTRVESKKAYDRKSGKKVDW